MTSPQTGATHLTSVPGDTAPLPVAALSPRHARHRATPATEPTTTTRAARKEARNRKRALAKALRRHRRETAIALHSLGTHYRWGARSPQEAITDLYALQDQIREAATGLAGLGATSPHLPGETLELNRASQ